MSGNVRARLAQFVCSHPKLANLFPRLCQRTGALQVSISPTAITHGTNGTITASGGTPSAQLTLYGVDSNNVKFQIYPVVTMFDSSGSLSTTAPINLAAGTYTISIHDLSSGDIALGNMFTVS